MKHVKGPIGALLHRRRVLYVGKALRLKNRLQPGQRHGMWEVLFDEDVIENFTEVYIAVWHIETEAERKRAEACLIQRFKPVFNTVNEGKAEWTYRLPDIDAVSPYSLLPRELKDDDDDAWEPCELQDRPGVYAWYQWPVLYPDAYCIEDWGPGPGSRLSLATIESDVGRNAGLAFLPIDQLVASLKP